jgi:hypothetical protein
MAPLLILLLMAALVVGWFASEFQDRRWLRLLLGGSALMLVGGGTFLATFLVEHFNANASYDLASGDLIDATVLGVEEGRTDEVLAELKRLRGRFHPTYENRAGYDRLVEEYVARLKAGSRGEGPEK